MDVLLKAGQKAIQEALLAQVDDPSGKTLKVLKKCYDSGYLFEHKQRGFMVHE